jgi:hypothetical protein
MEAKHASKDAGKQTRQPTINQAKLEYQFANFVAAQLRYRHRTYALPLAPILNQCIFFKERHNSNTMQNGSKFFWGAGRTRQSIQRRRLIGIEIE